MKLVQLVAEARRVFDVNMAIIDYMRQHGHLIFTGPGELNIVYVEGMWHDLRPNQDLIDGWNDVRIVFTMEGAAPIVRHLAQATTEPGLSATMSEAAKARGGVARIAFGQYTAWCIGYHKQSKYGTGHPALVQVKEVKVHRDLNRDGARTGDKAYTGLFGINQHGTRLGFDGERVGFFSEGCLVGLDWDQHLSFVRLLKTDPRYQADNKFVYTTTVIPGDSLFPQV